MKKLILEDMIEEVCDELTATQKLVVSEEFDIHYNDALKVLKAAEKLGFTSPNSSSVNWVITVSDTTNDVNFDTMSINASNHIPPRLGAPTLPQTVSNLGVASSFAPYGMTKKQRREKISLESLKTELDNDN